MKISEVMKNYFKEEVITENIKIPFRIMDTSTPVEVKKPTWEIVKEPNPMLVKDFEFSNYIGLNDFINELLEYQEEINHHGEIEIKYRLVKIKVYTHTLEDITEIDRRYAKNVDFIYDDVKHYGEKNV